MKAAARQRVAGGQAQLNLGLGPAATAAAVAGSSGPLEIASSRMGHLWDGLSSAFDHLEFARAAGSDEAFRQLVLARIIEPTSKADSLRVLAEVSVAAASYPTLNRRLCSYSAEGFRRKLAHRVRPARRVGAGVARESIDAHLTIVLAALAVGRLVEDRTGWSIRRFMRTARRYRTVQIRAGGQLLAAEDPVPDDLRDALERITSPDGAH